MLRRQLGSFLLKHFFKAHLLAYLGGAHAVIQAIATIEPYQRHPLFH